MPNDKQTHPSKVPAVIVRAWIRYGTTYWEEFVMPRHDMLDVTEDFLRIAVNRHVLDFNHTDAGIRFPKRLLDLEVTYRELDPSYCDLQQLFPHEWQPNGALDKYACKLCGVLAYRRSIASAFKISDVEKMKHPFGCLPHLHPITR